MPKILFFDIDGTIMNNKTHTVSNSTINTLKQLKQNGHIVCIATGRGYDSLLKTGVQDLIKWDAIICNNGQIILNQDHEILFKSTFKKETIEAVIETANQLDLAVVLKSNPRIITKEPDEYVHTSQRHFNNTIPNVGKYTNQEVTAMIVFGPMNYDYKPFFEIPELNVMPGVVTYADLSMKGISKKSAIDYLLNYFNLESYYAFGDSMNDVEMLKGASHAIVMGQGEQEVKQYATFITNDIDHNGIEYACKHLNLIENIYFQNNKLKIRNMLPNDIDKILDNFAKQNWHKPKEVLEKYLTQQYKQERYVLIAEYQNTIAGYITIKKATKYGPYQNTYPELSDFIVFMPYQKNGIGNKLLECAETICAQFANTVTLAVGLHAGYGQAQRLYSKRGYLLEGSGVYYQNQKLTPYTNCINDDDLVIYMYKPLKKN